MQEGGYLEAVPRRILHRQEEAHFLLSHRNIAVKVSCLLQIPTVHYRRLGRLRPDRIE